MKKITAILTAVVLMLVMASTPAMAQKRAYYYYPSQNMYYDISGKQYVFRNGTNWTRSKTLPSGVTLVKTDSRVTVYHPGENVWDDNNGHRMKYKNVTPINQAGTNHNSTKRPYKKGKKN